MTILDYCGPLQMLDAYDIKVIELMIEELGLKSNKMFNFLNKIDLYNDVEFFYYDDKNDDVLGGFHSPSRNVIYLNLNGQQNETNTQKMNNVIALFPTIIHELCHFYQRKKYGMIIYGLLQLPFIRRFTIETTAYKISDYITPLSDEYFRKSMTELAELKLKYNFQKYQYDKIEIMYLKKEGIWDYM